jgi:hypothetical protein
MPGSCWRGEEAKAGYLLTKLFCAWSEKFLVRWRRLSSLYGLIRAGGDARPTNIFKNSQRVKNQGRTTDLINRGLIMSRNSFGKFFAVSLFLALALTGCAGLSQDISQEIKDDRREAREAMATADKNYKSHEYFSQISENSDRWNNTDWSLWMDTHGGGR